MLCSLHMLARPSRLHCHLCPEWQCSSHTAVLLVSQACTCLQCRSHLTLHHFWFCIIMSGVLMHSLVCPMFIDRLGSGL